MSFFFSKEPQIAEEEGDANENGKSNLHKWRWTWAAVPVVGLLGLGTLLVIIFTVRQIGEDVPTDTMRSSQNSSQKFFRKAGNECEAITINTSQGQSLQVYGLNLQNPCFSHGQLYFACSRVGKPRDLLEFLKLRSPRKSNFSEAVRQCSQLGGDVVVNPDKELMSGLFSKAVESKSCRLIYTGLRFNAKDWISRDRSIRFSGGSLNSMWDPEFYADVKNIPRKKFCSAAMNVGGETPHLVPFSCSKRKAHCFVCQTASANCVGNICYKPFIEALTVDDAELECKKRKSTLAAPDSFEKIRNAVRQINNVDKNKRCKIVAMGFVYNANLEDSLHNLLNFTLSPWDPKALMIHPCVGIDVGHKAYTRIDCSNADCTLCLVPQQLKFKKKKYPKRQ